VLAVALSLVAGPDRTGAGGIVATPTEAALRDAMFGGGSVVFACDGAIPITSSITNTVDVVLDGSGHEVILTASNATRIFFVATNVNCTLKHLTITNGQSTNGGGLFNCGGNITLLDVTLVGNLATNLPFMPFTGDGCGGAVLNQGGKLSATNCLFEANAATQTVAASVGRPFQGGALCNLSGTAVFHGCTFRGNSARGLNWNQNSLTGSSASGGAIYNGPGAFLAMEQCSVHRNRAEGGAGGEGFFNSMSDGGTGGTGGEARGGAIANQGGIVLSRSLFSSNGVVAGDGGQGGAGGAIEGGPTYNGGPGGAGGDCSGGAVYNTGIARMINSTFAGNTSAGGSGGAGGWPGYNRFPTPHSGQSGPGGMDGNATGAISSASAQMAFTNCTLVFNRAAAGSLGSAQAGGLQHAGGPLLNTLLATNTPANLGGTIADAGHNFSSDASAPFSGPGSRNSVEVCIGPLSDNGGPTLTIPLLARSPAIDAGFPLPGIPTDQREFPRQLGAAPDVGACEYGVPLLRISHVPVGGFGIVVAGALPGPCYLLSSTNLFNWTTVATNAVSLSGETVFQATAPASVEVFFRTAIRPPGL
jgi:hypothetical protein